MFFTAEVLVLASSDNESTSKVNPKKRKNNKDWIDDWDEG